MNVLGALLFVVALLISIVLHEAGHMVCARWSGGKVTEFFVGFGTRLWSFRRGETEYGIKAIPAGGYVKIVGMTDLDEIEPGDEDRALKNKPARMRLLTLSAGSLTHFLIALVLLFLSPMLFGVQKADSAAKVGNVAACLTAAGAPDDGCGPGSAKSPAARAGLATGDLITSVNGKHVANFDQLTVALHRLPANEQSTIAYTDPHGAQHTTTIVPVGVKSVTYPDGHTAPGSLVGLGQFGYVQHYNPVSAAAYSGRQFGSAVVGTFKGIGSIPAAIPKLFTSTVDHTQRSASSPVGVVGMAQLSGSIIGEAGFSGFFALVAVINVFIGIFNLLPILPLDGGHVAVLLYEEARKRVYRLLRRPVPGRVDLNKLMPVAYAFLLVFVGLTLLLLAADITNPIHLPS